MIPLSAQAREYFSAAKSLRGFTGGNIPSQATASRFLLDLARSDSPLAMSALRTLDDLGLAGVVEKLDVRPCDTEPECDR